MSDTPQDTFYVKAAVLAGSQPIAACSYYTDAACTQQVVSPLNSSRSTGVCRFVQAASSPLVLLGAVFKTLGNKPVLTSGNFVAAVPSSINPALFQVSLPMPVQTDGSVTTKGVVLMFSNPGEVSAIYPSSDPQVLNGGTP